MSDWPSHKKEPVATIIDSRREHERVTGPFDGCRLGLIETPLIIYDLSEGGCFINSLIDTPVGERLVLRISLPQAGVIAVDAETVHVRPGFGFAVRFTELNDETRARLELALDELRRKVA